MTAPLNDKVGLMRIPTSLWRDPVWLSALAAGPIFWLLFALLSLHVPTFDHFEFSRELAVVFLLTVIIYPVLEELVFRGLIQPELQRKSFFQRKILVFSFANIAASSLFSLFHLFNHELFWAMLVFFPSLVFGFFRDRYNSIAPSIFLHVFYNFGFSLLFSGMLAK